MSGQSDDPRTKGSAPLAPSSAPKQVEVVEIGDLGDVGEYEAEEDLHDAVEITGRSVIVLGDAGAPPAPTPTAPGGFAIPKPPPAPPTQAPALAAAAQRARTPTLMGVAPGAIPPPPAVGAPVRPSVPPPPPPSSQSQQMRASVPPHKPAPAPAASPSTGTTRPPVAPPPARLPSIVVDEAALAEPAPAAPPPPPAPPAPPVPTAAPAPVATPPAPVAAPPAPPVATPPAPLAPPVAAPVAQAVIAAPSPEPSTQTHTNARLDASRLPVIAPREHAPIALPSLAFEWPQPSEKESLTAEIDALAKEQPARAALLLAARALDGIRADIAGTDASLQRAHSLAPDSRAVAFAQRFVAEQLDRAGDVPALLRAELPLVSGARERLAILLEQALRDEKSGALDGVERALKESVALDPKDVAACDLLAHHWLKKRNPRDAASAFDALGNALTDQALRSMALTQAAALRECTLDDAPGAVALLRRALETHPGNLGAWASVEILHLRSGAWGDHARSLVAQGAQVDDALTAKELFDRAGDAFWMGAADIAAAVRCFEHVFGLARDDAAPVEKLRALLESTGRWEALVGTYERLILVLRDPTARACALFSLGGMLDARLNRPDDAAMAYQRALDVAPTFAPAIEALSALYRRQQRWAEWCALERVEAERCASITERAARFDAIAEVYEGKLGREDEAIALHERALALDGASVASAAALIRMLRGRGDWVRAAAVYERAIECAKDPKRKRALEYEHALLLIEHTSEAARGAALLQKVLEGGSEETLLLATLARARAQQGEWPSVVDALEKQSDAIKDGEEILRHLHRIAATIDARLSDPVRALSAWNKLLARAPHYRAALDAIRALHAAAGRWEEVVAVDRKLVALSKDPVEIAHRLYTIGRITEERLGRPDKALEAHEQALAKAPSFDPARFELERLLRALNRMPRLIEVFEARAASEADAASKSALLVRAARIAEFSLKDVNRALALYTQAAGLSADPMPALWGMARVHEQRGAWPKAEAALASLHQRAPTAVSRMRLSLRMARLYEFRLQNSTRAAACYEDAITAHSAAAMHVFDRLRVARADGARDIIGHWQKRLAQVSLDRRWSRALLVHRARLLEIDGASADECVAAYGAALALEPDDPVALESQARSLRGSPEDPRWAEALRARSVVSGDRSLEALLLWAAGRASERAGRHAEAAHDFERAMTAQPDLYCALEAARALASRRGEWDVAAQLALRSSEVSVEPRNRAEAELDAAELFEAQLDAPEQAIVHARAVLARRPDLSRACALSVRLSEASEDWAGVLESLGVHAQSISDATQRAMLYAQRANVAIERVGDARAALEDLQRAHQLLPKDVAVLDRLAREYERAERWREAADAWAQLASASADPTVRRRALIAQARLWADRMNDGEQARAILDPLVREEPGDRECASLFARVCASRGTLEDAERAADLYAFVAQSGEPAERVRFLLAVADVSAGLLRDDTRARDALAKALSMALSDPALIAPIEQHFAKDGAHRTFVALAEDAVRRASGPSATSSSISSPAIAPKGALPMRLTIARVLRESMKQPAAADEHLRAAIEAFPRATEPRLARAQARVATDELGAIQEFRDILEIDPTCGPAFRGLVTALQRIGSTVSAGVVASAALLCGEQAREVESALALAVTPPPREGALPPDDALAMLVGPTQSRYVRRVLAAIEPHWFELFPQGVEALRNYTRAPAGIPAVRMLETIALSLGAPAAQLYRGRGREALTTFAQPHALVLGADYFAEGAIPHLIFECARMSAHVGGLSVAIRVINSSDLLALLEVVTDPNVEEPGYKEMRRRAGSVLPRKVRKDIERIVEESAGASVRSELPRWIDEEARRGLRAGVVFARDLRTVAQIVAPEAAGVSGEARREVLSRNALMVDALRFCASDACSRALERVFGKT